VTNTNHKRYLPNKDRVSVLAAVIILAYTLTRFVNIPLPEYSLQLPGFYLVVNINAYTIIALLVAMITAAGSDWLLRSHPALEDRNPVQHWILPALTALVIGIPIAQLQSNILWWIGLFVGVILLILVLLGEFISIDAEDIRLPIAVAGLSAVSFSLYLILIVTLRSTGVRLFFFLPAIAMGTWLVSLRVSQMRLHGEWTLIETAIIALIVIQISAALHYWPISPISFGMVVLGVTYALISLISGLIEGKPTRQVLIEPIIALLIAFGVALVISLV
jgi:hypothetical protein